MDPQGMGPATVSGERPRGDGAHKAWGLWFLEVEELVHGFGSASQEKWPLGLDRRAGESLSSLWRGWIALLGFPVATLEVELTSALPPAPHWWSGGEHPVASAALDWWLGGP